MIQKVLLQIASMNVDQDVVEDKGKALPPLAVV